MNQYVRVCKSLYTKGDLIEESKVLDYVLNNNNDYYQGLYYFTEEQKNQFYEKIFDADKGIETIRGCKGITDVTTNKLWFDFDNEKDPSLSQKDCLIVLNKLIEHGIDENNIEIYFSGNKGFNLVLTTDKIFTPSQVYEICTNIAVDSNGNKLNTFDTSLYDAVQIFRIPGTKHNKSKLFKIPLKPNELKTLTFDNIKQKAKSLDNIVDEFNWDIVNFPQSLLKQEPIKNKNLIIVDDLDWSLKPSNWKNCKWSILQGNFKAGERHSALMVLAATCKGMGYDIHTTYYMCKSAIKKQAIKTGQPEFEKEELFKNIIEDSVFKDGWEGGQFTCKKTGWLQSYCKSLGKHACKHDEIDRETPVKLYEVKDGFIDFVKNIEQNTVKTGIRQLDTGMPLTVGMSCGIIGAAGAGKTALLLEILENTSKNNVPTVCASLDMHRNRFFEKTIYRVSNLSREQVYKKVKNNDYQDLISKVENAYKNVWFYDRSCPTVDDLKSYLLKVQEMSGQKVKLVVIDYFERINADKTEDTAASKEIAGKLQDLVNDFNICLIVMVQPNKFSLSGGPDQPIKNYTAIKGSSFLYQSFRSIVSIWRPFYTPETKELDKYMQMAILKNDLGELDTFNFGWHGRTGKINELSEEEEIRFKQLLKEKEEKKHIESGGEWD